MAGSSRNSLGRHNEIKFAPNEPATTQPGEVKISYLTPEELEREYGHLRKPLSSDQKKGLLGFAVTGIITKENLLHDLRAGKSILILARRYRRTKEDILELCKTYGIKLDEEHRLVTDMNEERGEDTVEVNPVYNLEEKHEEKHEEKPKEKFETFDPNTTQETKMDAARRKLPKEVLAAELADGTKQSVIAREYGVPQVYVSKLKKEYGLETMGAVTEFLAQRAAVGGGEKVEEAEGQETLGHEQQPKQQSEHVCNCKPCLDLKMLSEEVEMLSEEIDAIKRQLKAVTSFANDHRHNLVGGLYTEKGEV